MSGCRACGHSRKLGSYQCSVVTVRSGDTIIVQPLAPSLIDKLLSLLAVCRSIISPAVFAILLSMSQAWRPVSFPAVTPRGEANTSRSVLRQWLVRQSQRHLKSLAKAPRVARKVDEAFRRTLQAQWQRPRQSGTITMDSTPCISNPSTPFIPWLGLAPVCCMGRAAMTVVTLEVWGSSTLMP